MIPAETAEFPTTGSPPFADGVGTGVCICTGEGVGITTGVLEGDGVKEGAGVEVGVGDGVWLAA